MSETRITFLGAAAALPEAGRDTASFLVNGELLFDCGWCVAQRLLQFGGDPADVRTLFFTHCHPDHYMGLPSLLFHRGMSTPKGETPPPLTIVGPPDDLPVIHRLTRDFLQPERFRRAWHDTELHLLAPGGTWESGRYRIETFRALHPLTAVSGRLTDLESGVVIAFSGDTGPNPALVDLARGADLLIHEATLAPDLPEERLRPDHARPQDAARVAAAAEVRLLRLVHFAEQDRAAAAEAARALFPEAAPAEEGETLVLRKG